MDSERAHLLTVFEVGAQRERDEDPAVFSEQGCHPPPSFASYSGAAVCKDNALFPYTDPFNIVLEHQKALMAFLPITSGEEAQCIIPFSGMRTQRRFQL